MSDKKQDSKPDLRNPKTFQFPQSKPIAISEYKNLGYSLPNSINPPSVQTSYNYPPTKVLEKDRISDFKPKPLGKLTPFSFNG